MFLCVCVCACVRVCECMPRGMDFHLCADMSSLNNNSRSLFPKYRSLLKMPRGVDSHRLRGHKIINYNSRSLFPTYRSLLTLSPTILSPSLAPIHM